MKNCNKPCNENHYEPCNKEPIIKQLIDECSGRPIDYITVACAVLMLNGLNVEDTVNLINTYIDNLKRRISELENNQVEDLETKLNGFLALINDLWRLVQDLGNLGLLANPIRNYIEQHFVSKNDFAGLQISIENLFTQWFNRLTDILNKIGQGDVFNANNYYTKTEIDNLFNGIIKLSDLADYAKKSDLSNYQTKLIFDNIPTQNSNNPVKSGGVYSVLNAKLDKINDLDIIRNNANSAVKDVKFAFTNNSIVNSNVAKFTVPMTGVIAVKLYWDNSTPCDYILSKVNGDINGDGVVDIADLNILINIMLQKDTADMYDGRADVNGDGQIDVADVNKIINIMLGKEENGYTISYQNKNSESVIEGLTYYDASNKQMFYIYEKDGRQLLWPNLIENSDVYNKIKNKVGDKSADFKTVISFTEENTLTWPNLKATSFETGSVLIISNEEISIGELIVNETHPDGKQNITIQLENLKDKKYSNVDYTTHRAIQDDVDSTPGLETVD